MMNKLQSKALITSTVFIITIFLSTLVGCDKKEAVLSSYPEDDVSSVNSVSPVSEETSLEEELKINQETLSGSVDDNTKKKILELGLSSGDAEYLYKAWSDSGIPYVICQDDIYQYSIWEDGYISSGFMNSDVREKLRQEETSLYVKTEEEYIEICKKYIMQCLKAFNLDFTSFECKIRDTGEITAEISFTELQGNVHVNTGYIILSKGGELLSFNGTNYSLSDYKGDYLREQAIRDKASRFINQNNSTSGVDINFTDLYMSMNGAGIPVWVVKAQTEDATLYLFEFNAYSGKITFSETFPSFSIDPPPKQ